MTKKLNINQSCEIYDRTPGSPPLKISACSSSYPPDKNYLHNTSTHPGCLYSQGLEDHPPPAYRCSLPALQPFDNKCNEIHGEEIL